MSDTRAAIRELRSLGEKRSTQGLTDQEQSRLAELRERLGLPSEPAESRSGGPRSGGAPSAAPAAPAALTGPAAVARPAAQSPSTVGAPLEPAALPSFAPVPAPEPPAPALGHTRPELEAAVLGAMVQPRPPPAAEAPVEPSGASAEALLRSGQASEPTALASGNISARPTAMTTSAPALAAGPESTSSLGAARARQGTAPAPTPHGSPSGGRVTAGQASAFGATTDPTASAGPLRELASDALAPAAEAPPPVEAVPELETDELAPTTDTPALEALPDLEAGALASPTDSVPPPEALPERDADALGPTTDTPALEGPPDFEAGALDPATDTAPPLEALAVLDPGALDPAANAAPLEALPELEADALAPATDAPPPLEAVPELEAEALAPATDAPPLEALPELEADALAPLPPEPDTASLEESGVAAGAPVGAGPEDGSLAPARRPGSSLAERIDATVDSGDGEPDWGALPVAPEPDAHEAAGNFAPADLGAIPLDIADPAIDPAYPEGGGIIELSSADVELLDGESAPEPDLGGEPADPVPLAALHEFVGEQPADPRALEFDAHGEQPMLAPEDLQASEAELTAAHEAFHPAGAEPEPEPDLPPAPAPAAPRISFPRAPATPPPPPRPTPIPLTREAPPAPAPVRRMTPPPPAPRAPGPPPPGAAFAEPAARVPTLSAARPEPPRRAGFGQSGPFAKPPAVLMAPASLDVMDDDPGQPLPPPVAPDVDAATGGEVFGGAYLSPTFVEGEHRVVLHTLEGQVRRGTVKDLDLLDAVIRLTQQGRPPEAIAADRVKAIFFMQEPGAAPLRSAGRRIRVGFADGRQIVGFSDDVDTGEQGFFLVPADTRTHTARIYVFRAGIQSVSAA